MPELCTVKYGPLFKCYMNNAGGPLKQTWYMEKKKEDYYKG